MKRFLNDGVSLTHLSPKSSEIGLLFVAVFCMILVVLLYIPRPREIFMNLVCSSFIFVQKTVFWVKKGVSKAPKVRRTSEKKHFLSKMVSE